MKISEIIEWYESFSIEMGVETLLDYRKHLSCALVKMAEHIQHLEAEHKKVLHENKINLAIQKVSVSGTVQEREAHARKETKKSRMHEAHLDGTLKGYKIKFEAYSKVIDSMASYISTINR